MDEQQQQPMTGMLGGETPPVPASPPGVPVPGQPQGMPQGGEQMATPEQAQQLRELIGQMDGTQRDMDAQQMAGEGKLEKLRSDLLQRIFETLQIAGVDLSSRESVAQFIDKLKERDPKLAMWFEDSMNVLLGDTGGEIPGEEIPGGVLPTGDENMPTEPMQNEYENTEQEISPTEVLS